MLPKIHLGTLMTVTDAHLASQSRERKRAVMEARMSRNTEGFHVYQAYLKRLRRMHRAYVTKYKQQQHGDGSLDQPSSLFDIRGNYVTTHTSNSSNNKSKLPSLNHRLSLSRPLPSPIDAETSDSLRPHHHCSSFASPMACDSGGNKKDNKVVPGSLCSIHIPCGREDSFELTKSFQRDIKIGNNSNDGALPFRMWKQRRDQSGATSVYSQNYVSTGMAGPKHRVALNLNKPVSRTGLVTPSKWLTKIE